MSGPAVIFREVHRLRRLAHELQEQLDRVPRQLKAQQAKSVRHEGLYHEGQEAIKKLKVAVQKKEGELKDLHGKIARYQKQTNDVTAKKEYDALQQEIAHAKAECQRIEDEILTSMGEGEEKTALLPELEKAAKQAKAELTKFEQEAGARKADLAAQLADTQAKLKEAEKGIPENLREQYKRIVGGMGHDGMAVVRDRTCSACYTEVTAQKYSNLQQEEFVVCSCGRISYLPEGSVRPVTDEE